MWKQSKYPAGTVVVVTDIHGKPMGRGKLRTDFDADSDPEAEWDIPEIEMPDGKIIYGYECWWTPVAEITQECPRCNKVFEISKETLSDKCREVICPDCKLTFAM